MSRCFPYPPPGFTKSGICDPTLVESLKLHREAEKAKKVKKERKREKKQKEKLRETTGVEHKKHRHKKRRYEDCSNDVDSKTKRRSETEITEKSSITEEHANPSGSQNSIESTLNSMNRQSPCSPSDDRVNCGSIIRIRLPYQRQKDSEVYSTTSRQPPCPLQTSDNPTINRGKKPPPVQYSEGKQSIPIRGRSDINPSQCNVKSVYETGATREDNPCSTSGSAGSLLASTRVQDDPFKKAEPEPHEKHKSSSRSGSFKDRSSSFALQLRDLVENWVPPELPNESTEHENWLFNGNRCKAQRLEGDPSGLTTSTTTGFTHARFLTDANIYALPFTVPY